MEFYWAKTLTDRSFEVALDKVTSVLKDHGNLQIAKSFHEKGRDLRPFIISVY
jgi:hypothetical protein